MSARIAVCCDIPFCPAMVVASTVGRAHDDALREGWSRPGGAVGPDHCPLHATDGNARIVEDS